MRTRITWRRRTLAVWMTIGTAAFLSAVALTASPSAESRVAQASGKRRRRRHRARPTSTPSGRPIEPIFMRDRGGTMPGYAACVMCHTWQTSLRFDLETPATDAGWTAEQSRRTSR